MPNDLPDWGGLGAVPQVILDSALAGAGPFTRNVAVPPTALALAVVCAHGAETPIICQGQQSGIAYTVNGSGFSPKLGAGYNVFLWMASVDTGAHWGPAGGVLLGNVWLVAIFDPVSIDVLSATGGVLNVSPNEPTLANFVAGNVSADGATILTVAAGRTWFGTVWVSGNSGGAGANPNVTIAGAGATPPAGTEVVDAVIGASTATEASMVVQNVYVNCAASSSASLVGHISGANAYRAGAMGILL